MVRTRVGYAGGTSRNPTYHALGDHSETVEIDYDPSRVSYEQLLRVFWASHDPGSQPWSRQYRAAVFVHGEEQRRLAEKTRDEVAAGGRAPVRTAIVTAGTFYPAEEYHQKYYLRSERELFRELAAPYPEPGALTASTAVARVNGYLGGNGTLEQLKQELPSLGLTPRAGERLMERISARHR